MNVLTKWWQEMKHTSKQKAIERVEMDFRMCERDGRIYLMHQGFAFAIMPRDTTAEEIAHALNAARDAALKFERL